MNKGKICVRSLKELMLVELRDSKVVAYSKMGIVFIGLLFGVYLSIGRKMKQRTFWWVAIYLAIVFPVSVAFIWQKLELRNFRDWHVWLIPIGLKKGSVIIGVGLVCSLVIYLVFRCCYHFSKQASITWKKALIYVCFCSLIFLATISYFSSYWAMHYFGNIRFDQLVFTLSQPVEGGSGSQILDFLKDPFLHAVFWSVWLWGGLGVLLFMDSMGSKTLLSARYLSIPVALLAILAFSLSIQTLGYKDIKAYFFDKTKIYDEYYVNTKRTAVTFPNKKRNLIYLFLESMESSYSSKEYGGIEENNLIPHLTDMALQEGVSFSNSQKLGGMISIPGANQTVSSMFAQTSGIPLRTSGSLDVNDYGGKGTSFMPGAYTLGEILQKQGYNQMLYIGSPASFGGRDKYFMQHGAYEVRDYYWIQGQGLIPNGYSVWWGVEDEKLFPFAQQSITELANREKPFNFTLLTTDTHFEDGYASDQTPNLFNDQYSNVIHYSDEQVYNFLSWIKEQPFYDNTTIIVVGDHPTMGKDFFKDIDPNYQRTVYNVILNSPTKVEGSQQNRIFNATDMFPTTLASLGATIQGQRLGMGTNLYSGKPTLMEELGQQNYMDEIAKKSTFYNKKIIKGTDYKVENSQ